MGLDTNIYAGKNSIYYFRKNWELQGYFNDLCKRRYPDLKKPLFTEEQAHQWGWPDWQLIEENEMRMAEPEDCNCLHIPITIEDWSEFMEKVGSSSDYFEDYKICTDRITDAIAAGQKVTIHGWW